MFWIMLILFLFFLLYFWFTQRSIMILWILISSNKFFVLLEQSLPLLIMFDKLCQHFSHKFIVILKKFLLLDLFLSQFTLYLLYFLLSCILEYSLHVVIVRWKGKLGEGDSFELLTWVGLEGMPVIVVNHSVEGFEISHGL